MQRPPPALLLLLLVAFLAERTDAQSIRLRHPETSLELPPALANGLAPAGSGTRHPLPGHGILGALRRRISARPGSVIVHFDRTHNIRQLQYVLNDGQLATLYQRRSNITLPPPMASARDGTGGSPTEPSDIPKMVQIPYQAEQQHSSPIDQREDSTIDILNSKLRGVSQLVGDHLVIELPDHLLSASSRTDPGGPQASPNQVASSPGGMGSQLAAGVMDALSELSPDAKINILATVAADAVDLGGALTKTKLKKAEWLLDQLKGKLSAKIRELPALIDSKLRPKSSLGEAFVDGPANKVSLVLPTGEAVTASGPPGGSVYLRDRQGHLFPARLHLAASASKTVGPPQQQQVQPPPPPVQQQVQQQLAEPLSRQTLAPGEGGRR